MEICYLKQMMRLLKIGPVVLLFFSSAIYATDSKTIYFKSKDGIDIASELYMPHPKTAPFIVLFHQANWSRGEYKEIAPKLNSMGYNCMAVDLRSGGSVNDVTNQTKLNAVKAMKDTQYIHALPDMRAAVTYAATHFAEGKLIIWGSSYSAALSIKVGSEMKDQVDGILAFSPGEYFASEGRDFIASAAQKIKDPIFITSAKGEKNAWWGIYVAISAENKTYYLPESMGNHGSRALWSKFTDADDYWAAVSAFLSNI